MNTYEISLVTQDVDASGQWTGGDLKVTTVASMVSKTPRRAIARAQQIAAVRSPVVERFAEPRGATVGRDRFVRVTDQSGNVIDDIACTGADFVAEV